MTEQQLDRLAKLPKAWIAKKKTNTCFDSAGANVAQSDEETIAQGGDAKDKQRKADLLQLHLLLQGAQRLRDEVCGEESSNFHNNTGAITANNNSSTSSAISSSNRPRPEPDANPKGGVPHCANVVEGGAGGRQLNAATPATGAVSGCSPANSVDGTDHEGSDSASSREEDIVGPSYVKMRLI